MSRPSPRRPTAAALPPPRPRTDTHPTDREGTNRSPTNEPSTNRPTNTPRHRTATLTDARLRPPSPLSPSGTGTEDTAPPPPSESALPFGQAVRWGRARSPPTRERVPDENCFLVRRLTPETSGSEGREFPELGDSQPSPPISRELISTAPTATPPRATSRGGQAAVTNCEPAAYAATNRPSNCRP